MSIFQGCLILPALDLNLRLEHYKLIYPLISDSVLYYCDIALYPWECRCNSTIDLLNDFRFIYFFLVLQAKNCLPVTDILWSLWTIYKTCPPVHVCLLFEHSKQRSTKTFGLDCGQPSDMESQLLITLIALESFPYRWLSNRSWSETLALAFVTTAAEYIFNL